MVKGNHIDFHYRMLYTTYFHQQSPGGTSILHAIHMYHNAMWRRHLVNI